VSGKFSISSNVAEYKVKYGNQGPVSFFPFLFFVALGSAAGGGFCFIKCFGSE
jgi:hypothetical protein